MNLLFKPNPKTEAKAEAQGFILILPRITLNNYNLLKKTAIRSTERVGKGNLIRYIDRVRPERD